MSVCIAAISNEPHKEARIICVTDRKGSSVEFSNEDATIKQVFFHRHWMAMFAGEDISPCIPILRATTTTLEGQENTLENVQDAFEECYQDHLSHLAAAKHLGRWKLSIKEFLETGRKKFGPDNFDAMWSDIQQVKLSFRFLVCGFDDVKHPHIFVVRNPGYSEVLDVPGYYAIGNGAPAAMSILGFLRQNVIKSVAQTHYNVWCSKFMAEGATDVGKRSFPCEIGPIAQTKPTSSSHFDVEDLVRAAWESGAKPSIPDGIIEEIEKVLTQEETLPSSEK